MLQEAVNEFADALDAYEVACYQSHALGDKPFSLDRCFEQVTLERDAWKRVVNALHRLYDLREGEKVPACRGHQQAG
jgi:hypothetical protein